MSKKTTQFKDVADFSKIELQANKYELMLLLSPAVTEDQRSKSVNELVAQLESRGAKVFHVDDWSKRDLAYSIKGQDQAYYITYYFTFSDTRFLSEFEELLKLDQSVLRHLLVRRADNFEIQKFEPHETDKANSKPRSELDTEQLDYKNIKLLNRYTSRYGKIVAKHYTKVTLKQQKKLAQEIKRSRHVALMPFVK
jgi:small subunit ribosomal protein S6